MSWGGLNDVRALGRLAIALGMAMLLAVHCTLADIPPISPRDFARRAVELERTPTWRYGYIMQFHAAVLVKSRTKPNAPPFLAPRTDDRFAAILTPEIHRRRPKAWAELILYLLLFAYARVVYALRDAQWPAPSLRRAASGGLAAFGFVALLLAPYLAIGYGEPLFDTPARPGTLSRFAAASINESVGPGISYALVAKLVVGIPLVSVLSVTNAPEHWLDVRAAIWLVSAAFWTLAAGLLPVIADRLLRRRYRVWTRKKRPDARL